MGGVTWHDEVVAEAMDVLRQHALSDERETVAQMIVLEHLAEVAYSAAHDPLTGLPNRAHVYATLDVLMEPGCSGSVAVLFIDMDRFKPVNDRLGHGVGDAVLREVATRLVAAAGPCEVVGRMGGDEFVVVYRGGHPRLVSSLARSRIMSRLAAPISIGDVVVRLDASVGIAFAACDGATSTDELLDLADADMFKRKRCRRLRSA